MEHEPSFERQVWEYGSRLEGVDRWIRDADRRFERIEAQLQAVPTLAVKIDNLMTVVSQLNSDVRAYATGAAPERRAEWSLVLQIVSFGVMAMIAVASLVVALVKSGVLH